MPRHPDFISKTSHLRDDEVDTLIKALKEKEVDGEPLAVHFINPQGAHCFNVNPTRQSEWDSFWGRWKSRFFQRRLEKR